MEHKSGADGTWSRTDTFIVIFLLVVLVGSGRTRISVDSHLYLSSAKSLASADMEAWFHWIREPLFPTILKTTHGLFGSSDLGYVVTISMVVLASLVVFSRVAFPRTPGIRRAFLLVAALNPAVHGYIGFVGRQALMLSLVVFGAAWALREIETPTDEVVSRSWLVASASIGIALALTSVVMLPAAFAIAAAPLLARLRLGKVLKSPKQVLVLGRRVLPSVVLVLASLVALGGWWGYKAAVVAEAPGANLRYWGFWPWDYDRDREAYERAGVGFVDVVRGLTAFGPEVQPIGDGVELYETAFELEYFGGYDRDWATDSCGIVTSTREDVVEYVDGYFAVSCRPSWGRYPRLLFADLALPAYRGALLALGFAAVYAFWSRRYLVLTLPAAGVLFPYIYSGSGISRYSFPLWPLGVAAIAFFIEDATARRRRVAGTSRAERQSPWSRNHSSGNAST
jgi:hypothetical protein